MDRRAPPLVKGSRISTLALAWALAPGVLAAQSATVTGRVLQSAAAIPIQGAFVTLTTSGGAPVQTRLTNSSGRFFFDGLAAGSYAVKADMIGYAELVSEVFMLAGEKLHRVDLSLEVSAVRLEGFNVSGERRCGMDAGEGATLARVWSEVREALERTQLSQVVPLTYEVLSATRELSPDDPEVDIDFPVVEAHTIVDGVPYFSLAPEILSEKGFVFRNPETSEIEFYGPDAGVLLSDEFTETHCFELEEGKKENEGLIGVGFEPIDGRDLPEIEGVLWLDPESVRLSHVEFRFRNVLSGRRERHTGGRIEFAELPSGLWIVTRWYLRIPLIWPDAHAEWGVKREKFRHRDVSSIREVAGEVQLVRDPDGEPILDGNAGLVLGIVVDDQSEEPVPGVLVRLGDTGRVTRTNAEGVFRFLTVSEGEYTVTFEEESTGVRGAVTELAARGVQTFIRFTISR